MNLQWKCNHLALCVFAEGHFLTACVVYSLTLSWWPAEYELRPELHFYLRCRASPYVIRDRRQRFATVPGGQLGKTTSVQKPHHMQRIRVFICYVRVKAKGQSITLLSLCRECLLQATQMFAGPWAFLPLTENASRNDFGVTNIFRQACGFQTWSIWISAASKDVENSRGGTVWEGWGGEGPCQNSGNT